MDGTADMSLQESCRDAARHLSAEVHLLAAKADRLEVENAKLRKLTGRMAKALGVGSGWCDRDCANEFGCDLRECPIETSMRKLGIEVDG